ncbi:MAG: hypothetical protein RMY16_08420 [Nostoc sp. DedQUE12b]|uniref:hypothetical protein n=1 Tax=Nostoc sp. DedQUE12b TaxID=3075398 RepID=UPI002AD346D4|nr:hypothetical protein [Nostoc sp. DedQUE12b]MDZ8085606.1 hypothetical protein [Nostoc sp. DedQUE12b]
MTTQTAINQLETEMTRLGWTWQHPRIQKFLQESATKVNRPVPNITTLSHKYIVHLTKLVHAYWECQHIMGILAIDWKDPQIIATFQKYGYPNRMPLKGWEQLAKELDARWFESGGGF